MQHIDWKRSQGQQMSQSNTGKKKVSGTNNTKKHQPKKEYSLRSKYSIKNATVSGKVTQENVYSKQRIKEDYYLTKTKIPLCLPNQTILV